MNKTTASKTVLGASCLAIALSLLLARPVEAGLTVHVSGTICKPSAKGDRPDISYSDLSAANTNTSGPRAIVCGLPMHYSIGKTLSYDFNVIDKSTTDAVRCNIVTLNKDNSVAYASPEKPSGDGNANFTGYQSMKVEFVMPGNEDATQRHYAVCTLPKSGGTSGGVSKHSALLGIRLY